MSEPHDPDELAGEYVLGTLPAEQRREVEARLPLDARLRAAVEQWEAHLLPLTGLAEPVIPSPRLWARIERSVAAYRPAPAVAAGPAVPVVPLPPGAAPAPAPAAADGWRRWWNSLDLWRGLSAAGFAVAALCVAVLVRQLAAPPPPPRFVVVLMAPQGKEAGWVVQARDAHQIQLIPLAKFELPADRALQFWTKADGWSGPVSLGLVQPGQTLQVSLDRLPPLQPNQLFELTLEPPNGSQTGRPTGPVQAIGRAVQTL